MDAKFGENHNFIQGLRRIHVGPQSVKIVCKVNCDVNYVYIIYEGSGSG